MTHPSPHPHPPKRKILNVGAFSRSRARFCTDRCEEFCPVDITSCATLEVIYCRSEFSVVVSDDCFYKQHGRKLLLLGAIDIWPVPPQNPLPAFPGFLFAFVWFPSGYQRSYSFATESTTRVLSSLFAHSIASSRRRDACPFVLCHRCTRAFVFGTFRQISVSFVKFR